MALSELPSTKENGDLEKSTGDDRVAANSNGSSGEKERKDEDGGISEVDLGGASKPVKRSFSEIVGNLPKISKHEVIVEEIDGEMMGMIPEDVFDEVKPIWSELLVGRFADTAPNFRVIHKIVNQIWNRAGLKEAKIEVFKVGDCTVKFRIRHQATRVKVLNRRMWNIAGIPMSVEKCAPQSEIVDEKASIVPLWVTMKGVPRGLYNDKGLSFLASRVGEPKKLHMDTELCTKFDEAKILVEVDLNGELPKVQQFRSKKGLKAKIAYSYPWLPVRCSLCTKWGHSAKICTQPKAVNEEKMEISVENRRDVEHGVADVQSVNDPVIGVEVAKESVAAGEMVTTQRGVTMA